MNGLRRIDIVGISVLVATTVLGYLAGVQPILAAHAEAVILRGRIASTERDLADLQAAKAAVLEDMKRLRRELESTSINPDLSTVRNERFAQLAQLAQLTGVQLETVRPGEQQRDEQNTTLPISLTGKGTFADCVSLLPRLRDVFPDFGLRRVGFERDGDENARIVIDLVWFISSNG